MSLQRITDFRHSYVTSSMLCLSVLHFSKLKSAMSISVLFDSHVSLQPLLMVSLLIDFTLKALKSRLALSFLSFACFLFISSSPLIR